MIFCTDDGVINKNGTKTPKNTIPNTMKVLE